MMENKPFVHTIKTPYGYYFYDVNTNKIIKIDGMVYQYLKNMDISPDLHVEKMLIDLKKDGYLSTKRPSKMIHSESDLIEYHLNENIEQVTLQVTQECNFKCAYCSYSIGESGRGHSSQRMSLEMAVSVIDFFVEHSKNRTSVCVGFYGGEPLLEFDLIKSIVYYAEKAFEGKDLRFTMTTNGSLFTNENINFLSKHNINILISIDGTPEIHNRSRKFAKTGEGTYHVIERNLKKIKNEFPELYSKFSFNIVVDPRNPCSELHELFSENELFKDAYIRSTLIDDHFSIEKVTESDEYAIENRMYQFKALLAELGKYSKNKVSKVAKSNITEMIDKYNTEMAVQKTLFANMSHSGPCIPGQRRLFVTVNGNFIPCERVNETSEVMIIGNIYDGFNYEKAREILNIAQLTEKKCIDCWALRHCTICARFCDNNGELSPAMKESNCRNVRYSTEQKLKYFIMFNELKNNM